MKLNPPNKISRTPKSKKDLSRENHTPVETQTTITNSLNFTEKQVAAIQKNSEYASAESRLSEIANSLSEDEIAILAKHKGLALKAEIKTRPHSFQVREDHLEKFQEYARILGKKKRHILSEALDDFFKKHLEEFNRIKHIKDF